MCYRDQVNDQKVLRPPAGKLVVLGGGNPYARLKNFHYLHDDVLGGGEGKTSAEATAPTAAAAAVFPTASNQTLEIEVLDPVGTCSMCGLSPGEANSRVLPLHRGVEDVVAGPGTKTRTRNLIY